MTKLATKLFPNKSAYYLLYVLLITIGYYSLVSIFWHIFLDKFEFNADRANQLFLYFSLAYIPAVLLGGYLGDFLWGNKKSLFAGSFLMFIAPFFLLGQSEIMLYLGLATLKFGKGIAETNALSGYIRQYKPENKLLDAGIAWQYLMVNLGGFGGLAILGTLYGTDQLNKWLINSSIFFALSFGVLFFIQHEPFQKQNLRIDLIKKIKLKPVRFAWASLIVTAFVSVIYFFQAQTLWYDFMYFSEKTQAFYNLTSWQNFNNLMEVFFIVLLAVLFTFYRFKDKKKLIFGLLAMIISLGILIILPQKITTIAQLSIYGAGLILFSLGDLLIYLTSFVLISRLINRNYLTIVIAVTFILISATKIISRFLYKYPFSVLDIVALCLLVPLFLWISIQYKKKID